MKTIHPPPLPQWLCFIWGAIFLILNKFRHAISGYRRPRPFSKNDIARAASYDQNVVTEWKEHLSRYTDGNFSLNEKDILELGPGADLGTGVILIYHGAKSYTALDVTPLARTAPDEIYTKLLRNLGVSAQELSKWHQEINQALKGKDGRLRYIVDPEFKVANLAPAAFDMVVSQASLEHVSNIAKMFRELKPRLRPGGIVVAEVDLQTHTRGLRNSDPLNIYRYSDWFYRHCSFLGSPNRVRPTEYRRALEAAGFNNIKIIPLTVVSDNYLKATLPHLANRFRSADNEMNILHFVLLARAHD